MSIVTASPDFYATLHEIFKIYEQELALFHLYSKCRKDLPKSSLGYVQTTEIPTLLIIEMIIANDRCFHEYYPDASRENIITNHKVAEKYLATGKINTDYLKLVETHPELIVQAIDYWIQQTSAYYFESTIYNIMTSLVEYYSVEILTKSVPYIWGIPGCEQKIEWQEFSRRKY